MRKLSSMRLLAMILMIVVGLFPDLAGTEMIKMSMEELTAEADTIVMGKVIKHESAWNDEHTAIFTDVTVEVAEVMKGSPGAEVTFRIAGGIVGQIGMRTSNDPVFKDGEHVVIFLSTKAAPSSVVGFFQGKYSVVNGNVTTSDGQTISVSEFTGYIRAVSNSE
jgi:hypothetical protein